MRSGGVVERTPGGGRIGGWVLEGLVVMRTRAWFWCRLLLAVVALVGLPGVGFAQGDGDAGGSAGAVGPAAGGGGGVVRSYEAVVQGGFGDGGGGPLAVIGELYTGDLSAFDPGRDFEVELRVSGWGAGIELATLSRHFSSVEAAVEARRAAASGSGTRDGHFVVQDGVDGVSLAAGVEGTLRLRPFGVVGVFLDGSFVNLFGSSARGRLWRVEEGEGGRPRFVAEVADAATGEVVGRVVREWELEPGAYHAVVRQRYVNLTDEMVRVRWVQEGPINLKEETSGYRIPLRRVRAGAIDEAMARRQGVESVRADGKLRTLQHVVTEYAEKRGPPALWPSDAFGEGFGSVLSWIGQTDRYFLASSYALVGEVSSASPMAGGSVVVGDGGVGGFDKGLHVGDRVEPWVVYERAAGVRTLELSDPLRHARLMLRTYSTVAEVGAGEELVLDFGVYLGPLDDDAMGADGPGGAAGLGSPSSVSLGSAIEYNLGGFASCCTFPWLGRILLGVLRFFHGFTMDWAVSIVLLVLLVRTVLHPITKKSQVGLMRFGKQMQRIAPKQKKIQERYKDDPKKLREEVQKLMREEGINPAGALGCLPMFLQTPIWIALYAMLYMVFDLRHQGGFYGVFQSVTGGNWGFLADLSRGDSFIPLPDAVHFTLPLMGTISAINVIPVLMGILFFIQQKYMTPPPSAQMSPEMQTQQKIMKVMLVVMLPVFMYNAPAALTLYFMTNSTLGILESRYIRNHVDQLESDLEEHGVKTVRELKKRKKVASSSRPLSDGRGFKDRG
mgnify:CR=1 FL=1